MTECWLGVHCTFGYTDTAFCKRVWVGVGVRKERGLSVLLLRVSLRVYTVGEAGFFRMGRTFKSFPPLPTAAAAAPLPLCSVLFIPTPPSLSHTLWLPPTPFQRDPLYAAERRKMHIWKNGAKRVDVYSKFQN